MRGKVWLISLLLFFGICKTKAAIFECTDKSECSDNAECVRNQCDCGPGKIYNSLGVKCLDLASGYGQECGDWEQCALLAGSYACTNNKCACSEGWVYLMGKCIENKKLFDDCTDDKECFDGMDYFARKCIGNKCECNTGYYNRADVDCRRIRSIGETCSINLDCKFPNGGCEKGRCIDTNLPSTEQLEIRLNDDDDDDEPPTPSTAPPLIGITCDTSADCPAIASYCSPLLRQCLCSAGYFQMGDACVHELGSQCSAKEDCVGIGVDCINKVCTCTDRYQYKEGNMRCIKAPFADDFLCSATEACKIFGNSYVCDTEKKCSCLSGFALNANSICQRSVNSGDICTSDQECDLKIKNSICDPTGACVCGDKFEFNDVTVHCDALLGGACGSLEDCKIKNSVCRTNCTCADSFVQIGERTCIKAASELHQKCTQDIECHAILTGSHCSNNLCECKMDFLEINRVCLKKPSRTSAITGVIRSCQSGASIHNEQKYQGRGPRRQALYYVCTASPKGTRSNIGLSGYPAYNFATDGVGDVCNNKQMCDLLGDDFVCRYGICQCASNAKVSSNGKRCEVRNSGARKRVWSPTLFGGVAIAYSMIVGVFL